MQRFLRSPFRIMMAATLLLFLSFFTLSLAAQIKNISAEQGISPQIETNQRLIYAANKLATDFFNSHFNEMSTARTRQQQATLYADVARLSANQNALLATSTNLNNSPHL